MAGESRQLVLVLDFGGQYNQLIARQVRSHGVYAEIRPGNLPLDEIVSLGPIGIILTGGPDSVYLPGSPRPADGLWQLGIPILGICYGMQLMAGELGGKVAAGRSGEYGVVAVRPDAGSSELFYGIDTAFAALMSHRDQVVGIPTGFHATAYSDNCLAAFEDTSRRLYGVQFHPESAQSEAGGQIIGNFCYRVAAAQGDYRLDDYLDSQIELVRRQVGDQRVLLALSGGVDSAVLAGLLARAIPGQLCSIFVDHGLLRLGEAEAVEAAFSQRGFGFIRVDAAKRFRARLAGITEPEEKRKLIGEEFIRVFEAEARKLGDIRFLAQGTIYPDVIESGGSYGATIKSHHNVGGLPDRLAFDAVIEPLAGLFKDEVRRLGEQLGLPPSIVNRQPFPGPGLAIRVIGEVTGYKLQILRACDAIVTEELDGLDGEGRPDQYFAVLTDTSTVGVKGDDRTVGPVVAVRAVTTGDFMTAGYALLPHQVLGRIAQRITSEVPEVSRVVYDITSKPPATVEWE